MEGWIIVGIVLLVIFCSNGKGTSDKFPGIEKAYNTLQKLPVDEKKVMEKHINDLIFIVKNNIQSLPEDVLNLEYTKKTINAFVWYYAMCVFFKKFKQEQCYMLLTIVLDKLDKDKIIKFKDFDTRIFKDNRFSDMPIMIEFYSKFHSHNNTIILVFIEKYMESVTGKKVRYMNQKPQEQQKQDKERKNNETDEDFKKIVDDFVERSRPAIRQWVEHLGEEIKETEKEKRKVASVNGIELSQDNDLNILDRPDKTQEYWKAREQVGSFLEERFKKYDGFRWIRVEPMSPKFDDMSFAYKNKIFSVLIYIKYSDDDMLSKRERDRFVKECSSNNLIPCIFPINDKQSLSLLSDEHWNLYDIRTNEIIDPLTVATDEKTMMSEYEFNNMAVDIVKNYIRKEKMKFESYCDIVGIFPQIWFEDKNNEMSWVYVNYSTTGKFSDINHELNKLIKGMPQFNGYMAQVGLICAEKGGPYRGAGFYVKFNGIEKIYAARRDTGHGYGINVKIQ